MIQQATLDFLRKLGKNNNREWFEKNKHLYLSAKEDVEKTVEAVLAGIRSFDKRIGSDLQAKHYMFRIYRDTRFAKDKRPYKTNIGANINPGGKKEQAPGYYLHIEPGNIFLAGGMWMPEGPLLAKIRQEIDYNLDEFKKIVNDKTFRKYFTALSTEDSLTTTPKGYAKDHPGIGFLRLKSFIVVSELPDKDATAKTFTKKASDIFKAMKPLNDFLQRAID